MNPTDDLTAEPGKPRDPWALIQHLTAELKRRKAADDDLREEWDAATAKLWEIGMPKDELMKSADLAVRIVADLREKVRILTEDREKLQQQISGADGKCEHGEHAGNACPICDWNAK